MWLRGGDGEPEGSRSVYGNVSATILRRYSSFRLAPLRKPARGPSRLLAVVAEVAVTNSGAWQRIDSVSGKNAKCKLSVEELLMKNGLVTIALLVLLIASSTKAQDITVTWQVTGKNISTGFLPKVASDGQNYVATIDMEKASPVHDGFPNSPFQYQLGTILSASGYVDWTGDSEFLHSPPQPQGDHQIGLAPSLALYFETGYPNCDLAVEVHQGAQHEDSELWYQLGRYCSGFPGIHWLHSYHYANGYNATVAADNNETFPHKTTVVEVHQADNGASALSYQVGVVTAGTPPSITWGPSTPILQSDGAATEGNLPTVSVANNLAILVYESSASDGVLWYSLGNVDTATSAIAWGDPIFYGFGFNPTVSIYGDGSGFYGVGSGRVVVEAHQTGTGSDIGLLEYTAGLLTGATPTSVTWSTSANNPYGTGCYPSVALSFDGHAPGTGSTASLSLTATNEIDCGTASTIQYSFGYLVATP
jgi:hypothetical protein